MVAHFSNSNQSQTKSKSSINSQQLSRETIRPFHLAHISSTINCHHPYYFADALRDIVRKLFIWKPTRKRLLHSGWLLHVPNLRIFVASPHQKRLHFAREIWRYRSRPVTCDAKALPRSQTNAVDARQGRTKGGFITSVLDTCYGLRGRRVVNEIQLFFRIATKTSKHFSTYLHIANSQHIL